MPYAALVIGLIQALPEISDEIKSLLVPIQEGRAPTEAEWEAAKAAADQANQAVQAG